MSALDAAAESVLIATGRRRAARCATADRQGCTAVVVHAGDLAVDRRALREAVGGTYRQHRRVEVVHVLVPQGLQRAVDRQGRREGVGSPHEPQVALRPGGVAVVVAADHAGADLGAAEHDVAVQGEPAVGLVAAVQTAKDGVRRGTQRAAVKLVVGDSRTPGRAVVLGHGRPLPAGIAVARDLGTVGAHRARTGVDGVTAEAVGGAQGQAPERTAPGQRVVDPRIRDVGVEATQPIEVGAEDVGAEHRQVQHRVLAPERYRAIGRRQSDEGLAAEDAPSLPEAAGGRCEAHLEREDGGKAIAERFRPAKTQARGKRTGRRRHAPVVAAGLDIAEVLDAHVQQTVDGHGRGLGLRRSGGCQRRQGGEGRKLHRVLSWSVKGARGLRRDLATSSRP